MEKEQGSSINFNIVLEDGDTSANVDDFDEIIFYAYTDSCFISKFSKTTKEGYHTLTVFDSKTLTGTIPGEDTKNMVGALYVDIFFDKNIKGTITTGIKIVKNLIKIEA